MKFTRIPIRTSPSGNQSYIPVYFFKGTNPKAKSVYIQSSVHGAEVQGNAVIYSLIDYFKKNPPLGNVTLVPLANPVGMDRKTGEWTDGRFDSTTGDNWNRAYLYFNTNEMDVRGWSPLEFKKFMLGKIQEKLKQPLKFSEKLALTLQSMALQTDLILDLHNANVSVPHAYVPNIVLDEAPYLGIHHLISVPPIFGGALDEAITVPWFHFHQQNPTQPLLELPHGFTLELGAQESLSLSEGQVQANSILNYLKFKKVIKGKPQNPKSVFICELKNYQTIYAKSGGLFDFILPLGKECKKGSILAKQLNFSAKGGVLNDIKLAFDFMPILRYSSALVQEGDELMKGFTNWKII